MPKAGTTHGRGYGKRHEAERRRWEPVVAAGRATCWRCKQWLDPTQPWDLGHDDHDRSRYRGPEHTHCNRSAGGKASGKARYGSGPYVQRTW
jgi:hypothetical protein